MNGGTVPDIRMDSVAIRSRSWRGSCKLPISMTRSPAPVRTSGRSKPHEALRTIQEESDRGWRDPHVVKLFVRIHKTVIDQLPTTDHSLQALRAYVGTA